MRLIKKLYDRNSPYPWIDTYGIISITATSFLFALFYFSLSFIIGTKIDTDFQEKVDYFTYINKIAESTSIHIYIIDSLKPFSFSRPYVHPYVIIFMRCRCFQVEERRE